MIQPRLIEPGVLHIAGHRFAYHLKSGAWHAARTPWRITRTDTEGWYAVNVATHERLTTTSQTLRQLRTVLALKLRREQE